MKILSDEKTTELSRYTPTADEWAIRPNYAYWAFRKLCEAQARLTREETLKEVELYFGSLCPHGMEPWELLEVRKHLREQRERQLPES